MSERSSCDVCGESCVCPAAQPSRRSIVKGAVALAAYTAPAMTVLMHGTDANAQYKGGYGGGYGNSRAGGNGNGNNGNGNGNGGSNGCGGFPGNGGNGNPGGNGNHNGWGNGVGSPC